MGNATIQHTEHRQFVCREHGTVYASCCSGKPGERTKHLVDCRCAEAVDAVEALIRLVHEFRRTGILTLAQYKQARDLAKIIASGDESDTDWKAVLDIAMEGALG